MKIFNQQKSEYFNQSDHWSRDIYSHAIIWRNWALLIALCSLIMAIIALIAIHKLLPLKENTPFLVFIDSQKGEPLMIRPAASEEMLDNVHLKKYMIRKFITARERFVPSTHSEDTHIVAALAHPQVYQEYEQHLSKNNPSSPLHLYKDATLNIIQMNILFLNEQRAYVSFNLLLNQDGVIKELPMNADIKFHFAHREMTLDEAGLINPVNFEVLSYQSHYQVNQEVL